MFSHNIKPSNDFDVEVEMTYSDGIYSTSLTFGLNHVDYFGTVEEHIDFFMQQPTLYGTPREIMIRDVENLKKQTEG